MVPGLWTEIASAFFRFASEAYTFRPRLDGVVGAEVDLAEDWGRDVMRFH